MSSTHHRSRIRPSRASPRTHTIRIIEGPSGPPRRYMTRRATTLTTLTPTRLIMACRSTTRPPTTTRS